MRNPQLIYQQQSVKNASPLQLMVKMYGPVPQAAYREDDKREERVELLTKQQDQLNIELISDEERDTIQSLLNKFERLNAKIDKALKDALRTSRESLASATT